MEKAKEKLIIALDDLSLEQAIKLVEQTHNFAETYKVGLSMFYAFGNEILKELKQFKGVEIFLDLKLHDIPMQVAKAVEVVLKYEPKFLTIHASGGFSMMKEAAKASANTDTKLLAVSVLTSLDQQQWSSLGFSHSIENSVSKMLDMAFEAGIAGFVLSPKELLKTKERFNEQAVLICPGIRPSSGIKTDDQKRTMTAGQAIALGADHLVIGRPITKAANVLEAAKQINEEITIALSDNEKIS